MQARIIVNDLDIRTAIANYICATTNLVVSPDDVKIKVKSDNNYKKQEWEPGILQCEFEAPVKIDS